MALDLRQVEVRAAAVGDEPLGVVEEEDAEIEERRRHRIAVDQHVALEHVPAARTHDEGRRLLVQRIALAVGVLEADGAVDRLAQVDLAAHHVVPRGRARILEVRHERRAPELSALMTILRSTGPVISTRRSCRSARTGAITNRRRGWRASPGGTRKWALPASRSAWRSARAFISSRRRGSYLRCRCATNSSARGVRMRSKKPGWSAGSWMPGMSKVSRFMVAVIDRGDRRMKPSPGAKEELEKRQGSLREMRRLKEARERPGGPRAAARKRAASRNRERKPTSAASPRDR